MADRVVRIIIRDDVPVFDESMGEPWWDVRVRYKETSMDDESYWTINPKNLEYFKKTITDCNKPDKVTFIVYK